MTRLQADLWVMLAALIWGVAFYFQKTAMTHIGPFLFLGLRALIAALVLAPFAFRETANSKPSVSSVVPIACMGGVVFFTAAALQQIGIVTATVTNTSFLTALYVVVTPFISWLLLRQQPGSTVWLGAGLAFAGTWALGGGTLSGFHHGDWLIAASSILWSLYIIVTGIAGKHAVPLTYTCLQFSVVALLALLAAFGFEHVNLTRIAAAGPAVLYVGVLSSALTFAILASVTRHSPAPRVAILLSLEAVFAVLAAAILLDERLPLIGWLGAGLILSSVIVIQLSRAGSREA